MKGDSLPSSLHLLLSPPGESKRVIDTLSSSQDEVIVVPEQKRKEKKIRLHDDKKADANWPQPLPDTRNEGCH